MRRAVILIAAMLPAALAGAGCSGGLHPGFAQGDFEAGQDIGRSRFQIYTFEPIRYLYRDPDQGGLVVRPYPGARTTASEAYVDGYNQRMLNWVARYGRPGTNLAPGVPSDSEQLRIESDMSNPESWVRLSDESGLLDLRNGWLLRFRRRDDGLYLVWLRSGGHEVGAQVTTPMLLPRKDGSIVLVQPEAKLGSPAHTVLFDPITPDCLFKVE
ncbi:MAG: hypothetical protein BIFFINMI_01805 [Phycisphaerae bacterium]|nr:hypothetical protein [Phycisphaerae bacterium]